MKHILASLFLCGSALLAGAQTIVEWEVVGHQPDADGKPTYTQRFIVKGDRSRLARLCFDQFDKPMTAVNPLDTVGRIIPGYYYIDSKRFAPTAKKAKKGKKGAEPDSLVIDIITGGTAPQYSFGADGVHGVDRDGKPFDVEFVRRSQTLRPEQWTAAGRDRMPYGDTFYDINAQLTEKPVKLRAYDLVPSFKTARYTGNGVYTGGRIIAEREIKAHNPEFIRIRITPDGIVAEGASPQAVKMARRTAERLIAANPEGLPEGMIEDWPDFGYRGMMIDVARNFQTLDQMKKFVDVMADYRMNRLQFHFIDDEAWRLEIPGLPELTEFGAKRGYTTDEANFLAQIYCGDGNPEADTNHGMYTREEFIDFLRYCYDRGVLVIPEIETPGHARAAVKAMDARWRRTGDDSYRLHEDGDTSVYRSAQDFSDNVMNPVLPGTHKFMNKVLDEVIAMYKDAGVPLESIHIGGDEVPHGGWSGSPSARKFMAEHGMTGESELHAYWVKSVADAVARRGQKLSGWQEIGLGHSQEYADEITPHVGFINLWIGYPGKDGVLPGEKALDAGYPVVVSAVDHFYLDLAHSYHPDERGLNWGGVTDEFKTLDGMPRKIAPAKPSAKGHIVGVQGQMWAETMRGPQWMERYLFPRMLAVAERGWNADTTYTHRQFNGLLGQRELPLLAKRGVEFHLRQPGIKVIDDMVNMNSPYADAVIRYTLDGSDPTAESPVYTGPFATDARQVRARLFYLGQESVPSILNIQ